MDASGSLVSSHPPHPEAPSTTAFKELALQRGIFNMLFRPLFVTSMFTHPNVTPPSFPRLPGEAPAHPSTRPPWLEKGVSSLTGGT